MSNFVSVGISGLLQLYSLNEKIAHGTGSNREKARQNNDHHAWSPANCQIQASWGGELTLQKTALHQDHTLASGTGSKNHLDEATAGI